MKIWECEECGHATTLSFTDEDVERVAEALHFALMDHRGIVPMELRDLTLPAREELLIMARAALDAYLEGKP